MSSYLVTGGAGFIGSNLVEAILKSGHNARVLDDLSTGRESNLNDALDWARAGGGDYEFRRGDIRDRETCTEAVRGMDFVLHQDGIEVTGFEVPDVRLSDHLPIICDFELR